MLFLGAFGVAATMGTEAGADLRSRVRTFFSRNVTLPAAILGLILPASTFSTGLVDASHVLRVLEQLEVRVGETPQPDRVNVATPEAIRGCPSIPSQA